jgi:hypothetical protein
MPSYNRSHRHRSTWPSQAGWCSLPSRTAIGEYIVFGPNNFRSPIDPTRTSELSRPDEWAHRSTILVHSPCPTLE